MIKGALFDFDGTLINTNQLIFESYRHTYKILLNQDITDDYILAYYGRPLLEAFTDRHGTELAEKMLSVYHEFNKAQHDRMAKPFDGVNQGLAELKERGIRIAVVTSKRRAMVQRGIDLLDIGKYLAAVITPEDTQKHKPGPEPALKASEVLGLAPEECVMVGDAIFDIQCGKAAGMKAVGVSYSLTPLDVLSQVGADTIVDSIADLPQWIASVNKQ